MKYNWQQNDWPHFKYDPKGLDELSLKFAEKNGYVEGFVKHLPADLRMEAVIEIMSNEAIKTSEIEGEFLSRKDVYSSIRNNLGLNHPLEKIHDVRARGVAELMIDVRKTFKQPLTEQKLFDWHTMLLGRDGDSDRIVIGSWRIGEEPMLVVSGYPGKQKIHFEAPPSNIISEEMQKFLDWFNHSAAGKTEEAYWPPVKAAIAHLYFESIHPFDDGNGRIGRAIAEKALFQSFNSPLLISFSKIIEANKKAYYDALEKAQRSNEITDWIHYFVNMLLESQIDAEKQITFIVKKSKFLNGFENKLNERQIKVLRRMLKEGVEGFEGGMNAKKYGIITHISKATATRDLQDLLEKGAIKQMGQGRTTRYDINLENE